MDIIFKMIQGFLKGFLSIVCVKEIWIVIAFVAILRLLYPKLRGMIGEFWVKCELKKLDKNKYYILNDIMIEDEFGTHQVDHIVVSKFGIFVIEMKNYYGLIIGDEYKEDWTQCLGKNKYYFKNPIHQNYGHIKSLSNILQIDSKYFISIVCFSNTTKLKLKSQSVVVQLDDLVKNINNFSETLLDTNLDNIINKINEKNISDKKKRKEHIKEIRRKKKEINEKVDNMICPKCGGTLITRNGKYGEFIGCSNYPKCKYTKK